MRRVGVLIAGLDGAVASTLVAGVALMRRGLAKPQALISEQFRQSHSLAGFEDMIIGGWDVRGENLFEAALRNRVVERERLQPVAKELSRLKPWPAGVDKIASFRRQHKLDAVVLLNLLPTGANKQSKVYAQLAARHDCPFINFTPNDCGDLSGVLHCGRDGKTGQTWFKSVLAPALRTRQLEVTGWFSTNLLGNEDGRIVGDPVKGRQKIRDKSKLLSEMLGYAPHHHVEIHYYPPRGDNKESWDNIDFTGFLGLPMQIKVNALYRDSILAAPMCLDLVRFMELAQRQKMRGAQTWLSLYFKAPYNAVTHDFHRQERLLWDFLSVPAPRAERGVVGRRCRSTLRVGRVCG
jgi:myo-inositol-1-phosphate synthase